MREIRVMFENEPKKEQYIGMLEKNLQDELLRAEMVEERVIVRKELNTLKQMRKNNENN